MMAFSVFGNSFLLQKTVFSLKMGILFQPISYKESPEQKIRNPKQIQITKFQNSKHNESSWMSCRTIGLSASEKSKAGKS